MINHLGTLWIDYTDMLNWKGHFTGTQRVAYEIANRLNEETDIQVKFFAYDQDIDVFYEVSKEHVANLFKTQEITDSLEQSFTAVPQSLKSKIRSQLVYAYHNQLPYSIKKQLTPTRREKIKAAYRKANTLRKRAILKQKSLSSSARDIISIQFKTNDTVLILGKPWDTMPFIDNLRSQKLTNNFRLVHLVYDMIPVFLPHAFGKPLPQNYTNYIFEALSLSDHILAISKSTAKDIKKFCDLQHMPSPPATVIRLGENVVAAVDKAYKIEDLKTSEFILCVGTIEVRKNHVLLYTAYKEALRNGIKVPPLVIVGGIGWYVNDVVYEFTHDPELKHLVKIMNRVDDVQLSWLYRNCKFTVYPSVYEGWGLPIAESLAYGKVCISSDTSSMTEVAGDLIDYFSPYDSAACARLIETYLDDKQRTAKETQIRSSYSSVTWDHTYEQVKKVL